MSSPIYTLRDAQVYDLEFLFGVIIAVRQPSVIFNWSEEFRKFKKGFELGKVQVIQYQNKDVGRLRIVRSEESIYVGGIQILPAFQRKRIGSAIFADLMVESRQTGIPVALEVYNENPAIEFYRKLGFVIRGGGMGYKNATYTP